MTKNDFLQGSDPDKVTNRQFLGTASGKLAAIGSAVMAIMTYVATDPSVVLYLVALLTFLSPVSRLLIVVSIAIIVYILPLWTTKKDAKDGEANPES